MLLSLGARADDAQAVRDRLAHTFDRPGARLVTGPIVVEQDYAIADWMQGGSGGRALLQKRKAGWSIVSCGGESIKAQETLTSAGLPKAQAAALLLKLRQAEQQQPAAKLQAFDHFRGRNSHH